MTVRPAPTVDRRGGTLRVESFNQSSIDPALLWPEAAFQLWQASYDTLVTYQRSGGNGGSMMVSDLAIALPPCPAPSRVCSGGSATTRARTCGWPTSPRRGTSTTGPRAGVSFVSERVGGYQYNPI